MQLNGLLLVFIVYIIVYQLLNVPCIYCLKLCLLWCASILLVRVLSWYEFAICGWLMGINQFSVYKLCELSSCSARKTIVYLTVKWCGFCMWDNIWSWSFCMQSCFMHLNSLTVFVLIIIPDFLGLGYIWYLVVATERFVKLVKEPILTLS